MSYFPADAAQHLSQKIFTATREGAVKDAAPFFVTEDSSPETNEQLDYRAVEYDFVNKAGKEVTVRGPIRAFVANDEGMGLIWPTKTGWPNILGLVRAPVATKETMADYLRSLSIIPCSSQSTCATSATPTSSLLLSGPGVMGNT